MGPRCEHPRHQTDEGEDRESMDPGVSLWPLDGKGNARDRGHADHPEPTTDTVGPMALAGPEQPGAQEHVTAGGDGVNDDDGRPGVGGGRHAHPMISKLE